MKPIKQSVCWWCFAREGISAQKLIAEAKRVGYNSIEMGPEEHFGAIREARLDVAIVSGHQSLGDGMNKPENHSRIVDEIHASIELALKYQIPSLICFSGNRYPAINDLRGAEICAEVLAQVTKPLEEKGINLCMELLNSKVDHHGYMCDRTEWGVHVCKMVNSPRVKLLYDIYHMQIMEGDLIRTIRDNIQWIGHFHTAGNPGRRDMDETQEIYYPPLARAIAETGYEGYVGHEFLPKGDPMAALEAAYQTWKVA